MGSMLDIAIRMGPYSKLLVLYSVYCMTGAEIEDFCPKGRSTQEVSISSDTTVVNFDTQERIFWHGPVKCFRDITYTVDPGVCPKARFVCFKSDIPNRKEDTRECRGGPRLVVRTSDRAAPRFCRHRKADVTFENWAMVSFIAGNPGRGSGSKGKGAHCIVGCTETIAVHYNAWHIGGRKAHKHKSLGCYRDRRYPRLLPEKIVNGQYIYIGYCQTICKNSGYAYAGLEVGTECWCGNVQPSDTYKIDKTYCDWACSGENSEYCGGVWAIHVYELV